MMSVTKRINNLNEYTVYLCTSFKAKACLVKLVTACMPADIFICDP